MRFTKDKNDCWNFAGPIDQYGYGKISFKDKTIAAHRLMAHITIKPLMKESEVVAHRCDNRACINPMHLFITTSRGNTKDRDEKGRGAIGEKHPNSKLTKGKVISIRARYENGESFSKLSTAFDVTIGCIQSVIERVTWKHVP